MVDITPLVSAGQQIIQAYGPSGFRVSGVAHDGAVIVLPSRTSPWPVHDISLLTPEDFALADDPSGPPDVVLLGTGSRMVLPPPAVRQALRAAGIALEPMDTGAACRTYNVLMAEGRRVAAALLPPS